MWGDYTAEICGFTVNFQAVSATADEQLFTKGRDVVAAEFMTSVAGLRYHQNDDARALISNG